MIIKINLIILLIKIYLYFIPNDKYDIIKGNLRNIEFRIFIIWNKFDKW